MPTKKIYTNTLAQIWAKVLTALISIVMIKIITNYLSVDGYGLYTKIYNYLSIFAVIADLGLYTITVRELTKYEDDKEMVTKISWNVLSLRTLSWIIIVFLSLGLAPFLSWYDTMSAYIGIAIASLFTLAWLVNSSLMSYLQATLRTEFSLVANTSGKLLTFGLILLFASVLYPVVSEVSTPLWRGDTGGFLWTSEWRLTLVMLAGLAGNVLMTTLTWWYANRYQKVRFAWDTEYIKHIIKISLPYGIALFLNVIFFKVDTILLSVMESREIADTAVALYGLPMKLVEVGMMYGTIFLNSLLPVLTTAIEKWDDAKFRKITRHALLLLLWGWIIGTSILYFGAEYITRLISTEEYISTRVLGYSSVDALRIVAPIFLVYFVSSLYTYILIARGEQWKMMYINAFVAIVNIIGNIIFIPLYSFIGSAWVTLVTQILLLMITYIVVRNTRKI
jgi:O-antigen/teichoic acid export membrane protein